MANWICRAGATKLGVPNVGLAGLLTPSPNFCGIGPRKCRRAIDRVDRIDVLPVKQVEDFGAGLGFNPLG